MKNLVNYKINKLITLVILLISIIFSLAEVVLAATPTPPPPMPEYPGQAVFNRYGIVLAFMFAFLMINLFPWMFKVPPKLPYHVVKARQSVAALQRILVPARSAIASERTVELACRLGEQQKAEILLLYVIEVPFTLSLNARMPEEEAKGHETLMTARFIVEQHGLPVKTKIIHHRTTWGGIISGAREELVDAIVMNGGRGGTSEGLSSVAQEVVKRAECEVILDWTSYRPVPMGVTKPG